MDFLISGSSNFKRRDMMPVSCPSVSAWMSMYTLDRVDDACRKMANKTILQALGASGDLEDGDSPAITQALEQKGYSSSTKVGAGFQEPDTSTLVPPLTVRQANVVKAIQRSRTGKLLSQSTLLSVCFHVRGSTSRACKKDVWLIWRRFSLELHFQ